MIEELVAHLLGVDADDHWDDLPAMFVDKYEIELFCAERLISDLLPLCMEAESPLSGTVFCGFANKKEGRWLMKTEAQ